MPKLILYLFLICVKFSISQNLVLNPSFEDYSAANKFPNKWVKISGFPYVITKTKKENTNQEYYLDSTKFFGSKLIEIGSTEDGKGAAILGLLIHNLEKDRVYTIKIKAIRPAKFGVQLPKLVNVFLSDSIIKKREGVHAFNLPFLKMYKADSTDIMSRTDWVDLTTKYVAIGTEKYILISGQNKIIDKSKHSYTKVWIDSISVYPTNIILNQTVTLDSIFFESGKDKLTSPSQKKLDKMLSLFNASKDLKIKITGHTDNKGDSKKNMQLSVSRSQSVMNYLISKGINKERISIEGFGDTRPVNTNETEEGRSKNRRIAFELSR